MDKPVIIIGGGIVGSLLAYRLKEVLPQMSFKLYEASSSLGQHQSFSFRESDCAKDMHWLKPLISHSWDHHQISFKKFDKMITNPYHLIDSRKMNEVISLKLKDDLKVHNKIPLELALQEASFVIDTRNECYYKKSGYKKFLSFEIELEEPHHMISPVVFDGKVDKKEIYRNISYFPLTENTMLVKDFWYSDNRRIDVAEMRTVLNDTIKEKGWKISKVLREESGVVAVPLTPPTFHQEGRVISLAGLFHGSTISSIGAMTKLIDEMVSTSFRYGELREIVSKFRKSEGEVQGFYRSLNKILIEEKKDFIFERIYNQPYSIIEKFSSGNLSFFDRSKMILMGKELSFPSNLKTLIPSVPHLSAIFKLPKSQISR